MSRTVTAEVLALIKSNEGLRLDAYRDPVGILTIGYGHTGDDVCEGEQITEADAEGLLQGDLERFEVTVDGWTRDVPTSDGQFSAMMSLAYNIGLGAFKGSTVLRKHRQGQFDEAGAAFLLWDKGHVDGALVVLPGLQLRRQQECAIYLGDSQE